MESNKTLACPVEEDSKTSKEESSKPEESQCELVVEGGETLPPFEASVTKGSTDDAKLSKETNSDNQGNAGFFPAFVAIYFLSTHYVKAIWCYLMSGFLNAPHGPATRFLNQVYSKILGSMSCLCSVASVYGALIVISRIPGASASASEKCVGNSYHCLSLAQNGTKLFDDGTKWFDEYNDCMNVRCLHLSEGQHDLLRFFPNVEELYMDDMGNITIPCDVFKNLSNLLKFEFHVKNFLCDPLFGLSQVTVAELRYTPPFPCVFTKVIANMCFPNDQAPTSVSTGIISERVTTTAGNMVNQEKDTGIGVGGAFASGECVGNSDYCLSLARNGTKLFDDGTKWFDEYNDCMNVRCLHLSEGQHDLLQFFPNVEELYMDDMGNITIPCDVFKNLSNLLKFEFHVKNFLCDPLFGLSQVTVAELRYTPPFSCVFTKVIANMCFPNDQAPTNVSTGIIPEFVTTTAGNMVNQGKDTGIGVGVVIGVLALGLVVGILLP